MIKQARSFVFGCILTSLVFSACLNFYLYYKINEMGYTQAQREQMDKMYSELK